MPLKNDCFALPAGVVWTPVDDALADLRARLSPVTAVESVALDAAQGRVLARDVVAGVSLPPADNSAVDGYAVAHASLTPSGEQRLALRPGRAAAGAPFDGTVKAGEAVRILTGAVMPDGTDSVVMDEDTEAGNDGAIRFAEVGCDCWIRVGHFPDERLVVREIARVERLLVASPGYLDEAGRPRTPRAVERHRFLALAPQPVEKRFGGSVFFFFPFPVHGGRLHRLLVGVRGLLVPFPPVRYNHGGRLHRLSCGFGDGFDRPLDLNRSGPQDGGHATFELIASPQGTTLTRHVDGVPAALLRFKRVAHAFTDFAAVAASMQVDPDKKWASHPFATRRLSDDERGTAATDGVQRVTLTTDRLKVQRGDEIDETPVDQRRWHMELDRWFGIVVPERPGD